jgi:hypothetical protein
LREHLVEFLENGGVESKIMGPSSTMIGI